MDTPPETFADLQIHPSVLRAIADVGYESPTGIQAATIPALLAGTDVVGLAQTGTGKTAAFAIPILSKIDTTSKATQALVLAPTRELALQVAEAFGRYGAHLPQLNVLPIYGGASYTVQLAGLRRGAQVVVGTPGRVIDHLERGTLDLSRVDYLVLDEADEMLTMGFAEEVDRILSETPEYKQVALFSATMPPAIRKITTKYLHDPLEVTSKAKTATAENISQRYIQVAGPRKMDALTRVLEVEPFEAMIVFVRTKQATEEVAEKLRARGFSAAAINGDIPQGQRERTIAALKDGNIDILVATDVAARGLDVERISHVLNYDIPHDTESYVHRIGRTGRAGRKGSAVLFVSPRERHLLKAIEKATRQPLTEAALPTVEDVNAQRVAKFADSITSALGGQGIELFRRLVEDYEREHDVPMADIAAALALQSRDGEAFLLAPDPPPERRDREKRGPQDRTERPRQTKPFTTYRIDVGKRHKIGPGAIVGAIANEGGLHRSDFGHIAIGPDFSMVELPAKLPRAVLKKLENTRISGVLINLRPDRQSDKRAPPQRRWQTAPETRRMTVSEEQDQGGLEQVSGVDRVASLTGVRAVAALLVVGTHAAYTTGKYTHGYWGLVGARMEIGVPIFFVLSGYLLFRPWVKAAQTGGPPPSLTRYARHRVRRIMPAYVITVLVAYVLYHFREAGPNPGHSWLGLIRNLTLTQIYTDGYLGKYLHQGLTQMWSLAVEASFYVLLPLLSYLLLVSISRRRWRPKLVIATILALMLISPGWLILVHSNHQIPDGARLWLPTYLAWFLGGMLLTVLQAERVRCYAFAAIPLAVVCYFIVSTPIAGAPTTSPASLPEALWKTVFYTVIATLAVAPLALGNQGWYSVLLASRPMVWLGEISYEIFLIHLITMEFAMVYIVRAHVYTGPMLYLYVATVVVTIPLAWLLNRLTRV